MSLFVKAVGLAGKVGGMIWGIRGASDQDPSAEVVTSNRPIRAFFQLGLYAITLEGVRKFETSANGNLLHKPLSGVEKKAALMPHARTFLSKHVFGGLKIGDSVAAEAAAGYLVDLVVAVMDAVHEDELSTGQVKSE